VNETEKLDLLITKALLAMGFEAVMDGFDENQIALLDEIEDNPDGFLRVREAASVLHVTVATLQNADRRGTFPALRHPLTGRRVAVLPSRVWRAYRRSH